MMNLLSVLNYAKRNQRFTVININYRYKLINSIITTSSISNIDNITNETNNNVNNKLTNNNSLGIRICKLLASQGQCSRREADEYLKKGYVLIDNKVCTQLGYRVLPHQIVSLSDKAKQHQNKLRTIVLNKPLGYVSHADDHFKYTTAIELVQSSLSRLHHNNSCNNSNNNHSNNNHSNNHNSNNTINLNMTGFAPAGRLDINSTGLLILTQDGRIAKQIINHNSLIDKEYIVKIDNHLNKQQLELLNYGLSLDNQLLKPCNVTWIKQDIQSCSYILRFILTEGRKRQIRRMCDLVGVKVLSLHRIRIGNIGLKGLALGSWRVLHSNEKI